MKKEIIDAVNNLNEAFFDGETPMDFFGFEYKSNGFYECVCFMGVRIWADDYDNRRYNEDNDEYEPYEKFFTREAVSILDKLKTIKKRLSKMLKA